MKKVLTTLLLLVSVAGLSFAGESSGAERLARTQAASVTGGSTHALMMQHGRRMRRRWWRMRSNRGRTDNYWNRRRWNDRRRLNRGRTDNYWNRGRRNRGRGHGHN